MKTFYWFVLIILGIVMVYVPRLNFTVSLSLGMIVLILGVFGLAKNIFN
ncbi:MAG: hypothetical protein WCX27_00280 [Candidatus Paceibacterota bacterium]|jgi:hypothetical protein